MAAAASVPSTGFVDDIDPDESASNVSGATNTSTMYVRQSRRQAAFAAKQKIRKQQQLQLERSIAEIENEELLTSIEHQRQEMLLEMDRQRKEQESDRQRKEHELQVAKERAELSIRRKLMEISMREIDAEAETPIEEEEVESILNEKLSQVSKNKALLGSDLSGSYHDASNVLNNAEESAESTEDAEETVREEPSAMLKARVSSVDGVSVPPSSQTLPAISSTVKQPVVASNIARQQMFSEPITCIANPTTTSTSAVRLASTSIPSTSQSKVTDYLNSISLSPLHLTASPERLSSTLRLNQHTRPPDVDPTVARTDVTTAISTAPRWNPVVSTHNMRCFGDGERTVNFREPLYDTGMNRQSAQRAVNTNDELAKAINRLSITNEAVMLPKSELLKSDGSARNFQRFLTSFDMNIDCKSISNSAKLNYLI